jgi:hypothetical protein
MPEFATERTRASLPTSLQEQLGLNGTELRVLLRLLTWGSIAREQAATTASVKLNSVNAVIIGLRRKLTKHRIRLITVRDFGWRLPPEGQTKTVGMIKPAAGKSVDREVDAKPERQQKELSGRLKD